MNLSVIVPAYKEEKNIERTVRSVFSYLKEKNIEHEIIVVVDGSPDKTADIARSLSNEIPTLELIDYQKNKGKGFAVKTGMLKAKGDFRLFTDADNATTIDHIEKMMPYFEKGYGVVIASIAVRGHQVAAGSEPVWRRVFGKLGNLFIQIMAVPGIHDTQRGFKVFKAEAAEKIFPKLTIDRWGFDVEALALARKFGFKIKEVPINWKNAPESHVGLKAYFQVLMETVKIRLNLITNKYD
ncbi:MAG TPA: dolichyl-phosphate beta-glucosyltransferase [Candidatus Paceibacterota bacterium]|nr:dolichyl-phosphate beta-glucosyltransferase [Candidatus Paceibacterota bacterium]